MARPTRQARRERREQQRADGAGDRARRAQPVPAAEAEAQVAAPAHRGGVIGFVRECWAELQKVDWPNQKQVITGAVVVLIACTIVGTYLWAIDLIIKPLINNVLIK